MVGVVGGLIGAGIGAGIGAVIDGEGALCESYSFIKKEIKANVKKIQLDMSLLQGLLKHLKKQLNSCITEINVAKNEEDNNEVDEALQQYDRVVVDLNNIAEFLASLPRGQQSIQCQMQDPNNTENPNTTSDTATDTEVSEETQSIPDSEDIISIPDTEDSEESSIEEQIADIYDD